MEHKFFSVKVLDANEAELTVRHFISTDMQDRSGDIMEPSGMMLDGTPSVLKQHGKDPDVGGEPIARCLGLEVGEDAEGHKGIIATTQYYDGSHLTPPDNTGRRLFEKARDDYMPYWSIGFAAEKWKAVPGSGGGRHITQWHLYEYSQVGVPDNVSAKGIKPEDCEPLADFGVLVDGMNLGEELDEKELEDSVLFVDTKPYPNEHACRLLEPVKGAKTRRRNGEGDSDGKKYDVIYQQQKGGKWKRQAFRYPKDTWTAAAAEKHCQAHNGILFEPASTAEGKALEYVRAEVNYRAMFIAFESFMNALFGVSDVKEAKKLLKEFVGLVEPYAIGLVEETIALNQEEGKSLREHLDTVIAAAATKASDADAPAPEDPPAQEPTGEEPPAGEAAEETPEADPNSGEEVPAPEGEGENEPEAEPEAEPEEPPAPKSPIKGLRLVQTKTAPAPQRKGVRVTGLKSRGELANAVKDIASGAAKAELDRAKGRVE